MPEYTVVVRQTERYDRIVHVEAENKDGIVDAIGKLVVNGYEDGFLDTQSEDEAWTYEGGTTDILDVKEN